MLTQWSIERAIKLLFVFKYAVAVIEGNHKAFFAFRKQRKKGLTIETLSLNLARFQKKLLSRRLRF